MNKRDKEFNLALKSFGEKLKQSIENKKNLLKEGSKIITFTLTKNQIKEYIPIFSDNHIEVEIYIDILGQTSNISFTYGEDSEGFIITKYYYIGLKLSDDEYNKLRFSEQLDNINIEFNDIVIHSDGIDYEGIKFLIEFLSNIDKLTPEWYLGILKKILI